RAARKLIAAYEESLDRRLQHLEALKRAEWRPAPARPAVAAQAAFDQSEVPTRQVSAFEAAAPLTGRRSTTPALVLTSALGAAAALYVFNPPPLFPHAGASYRALRQVNVRNLPSTASAIRAVVARETVLNGTVQAASGGTAKWLKIDRGSHAGGYVAVQNLESL
ncbi:MAG TPA: hypothetical protein VF582_05880, partial [Allosphingosinicella sp.]